MTETLMIVGAMKFAKCLFATQLGVHFMQKGHRELVGKPVVEAKVFMHKKWSDFSNSEGDSV
jgi:hypothetical protein